MAEKITKQGEIDKEALEVLEKQVEIGIGDEKQMGRTELNYLCEMYSALVQFNKELDVLNNLVNAVSAEKLNAYFGKMKKNIKQEENRQKTMTKIEKSHEKSKKIVNN